MLHGLGASLAALILATTMGNSATDVEVIHMPDHPMADAAGYVLWHSDPNSLPPDSGRHGLESARRDPPPDMPGWPVQFLEDDPREGGILVQADGDPELEILVLSGKTTKRVHLLNHDGTERPGWPITIALGRRAMWGASFGDLDGDGVGEVVAFSDDSPQGTAGWTYAWHVDGTSVPGFPARTYGDQFCSPTVVDLDDDGRAEIIIGERRGTLGGGAYLFDGDGQVLPGWPVDLGHFPVASAGAADVDGDGVKEVFIQSYASLHAFRLDGSVVDGFPFTPLNGDAFQFSATVFADVDDDGLPEIACGTHGFDPTRGAVYLFDGDGSVLPGWPVFVSWWIYAPPTFADLDGDGVLEIVVGDAGVLGGPVNEMHAWHLDGSYVNGFPIGPLYGINAQVVVADVDGDGDPELVWDHAGEYADGSGRLMGCHHDATPIEGWPIHTSGATFLNTAACGDVDLDGDIEVLAIGAAALEPIVTLHLWDLPSPDAPGSIQMPMFQYGPGRDGLMEGNPTVDVGPSVKTQPILAVRTWRGRPQIRTESTA